MNKTLAIQEFVAAHPDAHLDQIAAGTGLDRALVTATCSKLALCGVLARTGVGRYSVNPDFVKGEKQPPKLRGFRAEKRARKSAKKSAGKLKSITDVARKHVCAQPGVSPLKTHALSTFAVLEQVIDLDGAEPMLLAAFKAHREALCLMAPTS